MGSVWTVRAAGARVFCPCCWLGVFFDRSRQIFPAFADWVEMEEDGGSQKVKKSQTRQKHRWDASAERRRPEKLDASSMKYYKHVGTV